MKADVRSHRKHTYHQIEPKYSPSAVSWLRKSFTSTCQRPIAFTAFSLGQITLIISFLTTILILLLCVDAPFFTQHFFDDIAFRAAWLTITQIPLIYLLSTKRGPLSFLAELSYERVNWLHRWIGRTVFVSATAHGAIMKASISVDDIVHSTNGVARWGIATYTLLLWIGLSSVLPLRHWSYRLFFVNHYISTALFLNVALQHVPSYARTPIYISASILALDKLSTAYAFLRNNISVARGLRARVSGRDKLIVGFPIQLSAATSGDTTILRIAHVPLSWKPGQHVRLYVPALGRWETHPFTPANCSVAPAPPLPPRRNVDVERRPATRQPRPTSEMLLLVKTKTGFTRRLAKYHRSWLARPCPNASTPTSPNQSLTAYVDGPYGNAPRWHEYETLVLIASSTGVSFALAVLDHLEQLCLTDTADIKTKSIKLVWTTRHIDIALDQLTQSIITRCAATLHDFGIGVQVERYTTCPEAQSQTTRRDFLQLPRKVSAKASLRIRHPDEIYDEWDREAEIEAAKWEGGDGYEMYDDESEGSETDTLIDEASSNKDGKEEDWMARLVDDEDEVTKRAGVPRNDITVDNELCDCATIQHHQRKTPSSKIIKETFGNQPDIPTILQSTLSQSTHGRTIISTCSNTNITKSIRQSITQTQMDPQSTITIDLHLHIQ